MIIWFPKIKDPGAHLLVKMDPFNWFMKRKLLIVRKNNKKNAKFKF